jgi:hypothetical protein
VGDDLEDNNTGAGIKRCSLQPETPMTTRSGKTALVVCDHLEPRRLMAVSLSGATNIGALAGRSSFSDSLSSTNKADLRKFTFSASGTFKATLSGLTATAYMQLIRDTNANGLVDSGETLASSTPGTASQTITRTLSSGTYYVRVAESASASTNYALTLKSDYAGNSLGSARNLGTLSAARSFKDFVGSDDTADFYKFTLSSTKPFTASLSGLAADANLQIIQDKNANGVIDSGETLGTSAKTGTASESLAKPLAAGTYYVRVYRGSGDTNYSLSLSPIGRLKIVFNYTYDASGFFTAHPAAKDRLNDAAATFALLNDNLSAITPGGSNTWSINFQNPGAGGGPGVTINNPTIAANTLTIYVGGRSDLGGSELGMGGPGGFSAGGSTSWLNTIRSRGQSGALNSTPTDFGPWGGAITFKSTANWNYNSTSPTSGQNDFFSVALHELGHVFGIGTSNSWLAKVSGLTFTGANARAAHGGVNAPLANSGHWAQNLISTVDGKSQTPVMVPSLLTGTRRRFTKLDYAGLADLGWAVPGIPTSTPAGAPMPAALARTSTATSSFIIDFSEQRIADQLLA